MQQEQELGQQSDCPYGPPQTPQVYTSERGCAIILAALTIFWVLALSTCHQNC